MTANPTAPAAMPSERKLALMLLTFGEFGSSPAREFEDASACARAILALFAPILAENRELRMQMLADEGQSREMRSLLVRAKDYIVYNADSLSMNSTATLLVEEIAAAIRAQGE